MVGYGESVVKKIAIERKKNLSPEDFARDHLQGVGAPVIITDAMDGWPARSKWTFEFFKEAYGQDFGTTQTSLDSEAAKLTKIGAYIDFLGNPSAELPGFWVNEKNGKPLRAAPARADTPPHLMGWHAFQKHIELHEDIKPAPYFVEDWVLSLNPMLRDIFEWTCGRDYWSIYVGPEGVLSKLHRDFWHTHAYLAQIRGRKNAILFSPEESHLIYDGQVDPEQPDFDRFELFDQATQYEGVIEAGDLLFMPPDWWHCIRALEKSITISHNFFNQTNFNEHLAGVMRKLPKLVDGFNRIPEWREALGVAWSPNDVGA